MIQSFSYNCIVHLSVHDKNAASDIHACVADCGGPHPCRPYSLNVDQGPCSHQVIIIKKTLPSWSVVITFCHHSPSINSTSTKSSMKVRNLTNAMHYAEVADICILKCPTLTNHFSIVFHSGCPKFSVELCKLPKNLEKNKKIWRGKGRKMQKNLKGVFVKLNTKTKTETTTKRGYKLHFRNESVHEYIQIQFTLSNLHIHWYDWSWVGTRPISKWSISELNTATAVRMAKVQKELEEQQRQQVQNNSSNEGHFCEN